METPKHLSTVVYSYKGMGFDNKKKWSIDTYYDIHKSWKQHAKWSKPDTNGQILSDATYMWYLE